ncbi:MAG: FAD-binding oxidoreductase [Pseudomonadota bacterium]
MKRNVESWGRYPKARQSVIPLTWRHLDFPLSPEAGKTYLPSGNGRSYGDSCLNDGGVLLDARGLDHFIDFDSIKGIIRCEAGVLLSEILELTVPRGWILPVIPGTRFVTVGGAIANDIHGKNHHREGTFGRHLNGFELLRSDNERINCSREKNREWFQATIGGLGLTGIILRAEIALKRIPHPAIDSVTVPFQNLEEFFRLSEKSDTEFEYTVAWIDCLAGGQNRGRGLFICGRHLDVSGTGPPEASGSGLDIPLVMPCSLINRPFVRVYNALNYFKTKKPVSRSILHYAPFFFPLDALGHWNRLYGPEGFMQYQCVIPHRNGKDALEEILRTCELKGMQSVLGILKVFGRMKSPGLLSFPRPGITLAMDFPNQGPSTLDLLEKLDRIVLAAGGAVYPAKDARMSAASFKRFFPNWELLEKFRDPKFSSSFWRRVTKGLT